MNNKILGLLTKLNSTLIRNGGDPIAGIKFTTGTLRIMAAEDDDNRIFDINPSSDTGRTYAGIPLIK